MLEVIRILFGAAFTLVVSVVFGQLFLWRLRISLNKGEATAFAFLSGAALASVAVFFLCLVSMARWSVFLLVGLGTVAWWGWRFRPLVRRRKQQAHVAWFNSYFVPFYLALAVFLFIYFINSLAPALSPPGATDHLGNIARIWQQHGFAWNYSTALSALPQGTEMLFLLAYSFGRDSSAALVHLFFLITLALLIVCYGKRFGFPKGGAFAAVLVVSAPVVGEAGVSADNDLALAALVFGVVYLLQVWDENKDVNLLISIGLLSGFASAVRYSGVLSLLFAAGFVWLRS